MSLRSKYLASSYEHEPELVDGQLLERPMPTPLHSWVQMLIGHWFLMHREAWLVVPLSELRTRIRPGRFRLLDVAVTRLRIFKYKPWTEPAADRH